jgi:[ribosomal protein S5]-alanine N-acetyltransferase
MVLETTRLQLRPYTPADLLALIAGLDEFSSQFGAQAAEGLREFFVSGDVSLEWLAMLQAARAGVADPWLFGFGVIERSSESVVATAGFKGPPDDAGIAEIAYAVAPSHQGRGYATEAASALVQFARADARVRQVRAHTLPEPNASTRVLTKCEFERVGEVVDPDDGLVWRWEWSPQSSG